MVLIRRRLQAQRREQAALIDKLNDELLAQKTFNSGRDYEYGTCKPSLQLEEMDAALAIIPKVNSLYVTNATRLFANVLHEHLGGCIRKTSSHEHTSVTWPLLDRPILRDEALETLGKLCPHLIDLPLDVPHGDLDA